MRKIILLACLLLGPIAANAQVSYTGGTYIQNFDSLSQDTFTPGSVIPLVIASNSTAWTDNSTLAGWYANQNTYTTAPTLLGLSLVNQMTSTGTGSDRALGSYLGTVAALNPITLGFALTNNTSSALTSFTLAFTAEDFTKGVGSVVATDLLDSFNLSYSTNASDVSGLGATNYQVIDGSSNLINLNLLSSVADTSRVQLTVSNINVAVGQNLWIRFDRSGLLGISDNAISIDDVSVSAVPEPSTYALVALGLLSLMVCRRMRPSQANRPRPGTPRMGSQGTWPVALLLLSLCLALAQPLSAAANGFSLSTDSQNKLWFDAGTAKTPVSNNALRQDFTGPWGSCKISQGKNEDGQRMVIVSLDSTAKAPVTFAFNGQPLKVSPGAFVTVYPDAAGTKVASNSDPLALEEVVVKATSPTPSIEDETNSVTAGSLAHPNRSYTYRPIWDSMMTRKDFDEVYSQSNRKDELFIINPGQYHEGVDTYTVALSESAPSNIWLRHESYIIQPNQKSASLNNSPAFVPVARPDQLMQVLESQDLFPGVTSYRDRAEAFYKLLPKITECSVQIQALLKKWDSGDITPEELQLLGSASKISWLIQANLVDKGLPLTNTAFGQFYGQVNVNLNPEATSGF